MEELKKRYLKYLAGRVNDLDYSEIDDFIEDESLGEEGVEYLRTLNLSVVESPE